MKKTAIKLFSVLLISIFLFGCDGNGSKNSGDAVDLKLNIEKGKKINYLMNTHFDMNMEMMGQKIATGGDVDYGYDLMVDDVDAEGNRMISAVIGSVKFKVNSMGINMGYDSKNVGDTTKEDMMSGMFRKMFGSMIGRSFKMTISPKGEIKSITGLTEMLDAMIAGMPGSEEEKAKIRKQLDQSFNPDQVKQSFGQGFNIYPDKPVKVGDSWTKNNKMGISGMTSDIAITYTVKEIKSDEVIVDLKGTIESIKTGSDVKDTASTTPKPQMDLKGDQTGTMTISRSSGVATSANIDMTMKGTVAIQGTKSPMDMKAKVTIETK